MDERNRKIIKEMEQIKESALPESEKEKRISQFGWRTGGIDNGEEEKNRQGKGEERIGEQQKSNPGQVALSPA